MSPYTKITIVLKNADNHIDYNRRIMDYLNDRHTAINDNMFTIAIDVADDSNINEFVADGMESIPAMKVYQDKPYIYGVNSILSTLARLEAAEDKSMTFIDNSKAARLDRQESYVSKPSPYISNTDDGSTNAFYSMIMEEMQNDEQEDPDSPSTLKARHQDLPETPLNDRAIEEQSKAYTKIYEERQRKNRQRKPAPLANPRGTSAPATNVGIDVDKFIQKGGYDKGEELLMRQIAENLR
jgi:hypothetical protein